MSSELYLSQLMNFSKLCRKEQNCIRIVMSRKVSHWPTRAHSVRSQRCGMPTTDDDEEGNFIFNEDEVNLNSEQAAALQDLDAKLDLNNSNFRGDVDVRSFRGLLNATYCQREPSLDLVAGQSRKRYSGRTIRRSRNLGRLS